MTLFRSVRMASMCFLFGAALGFASCDPGGGSAETCREYYTNTTEVSEQNKNFCLTQGSKGTGNCCVANDQCMSGKCCEKGQNCGGQPSCECMP